MCAFFRYRHEFKSNELWMEIKLVLDTFAQPLTELFKVCDDWWLNTITVRAIQMLCDIQMFKCLLVMMACYHYSPFSYHFLSSLFQATIELCQTHATDINALKVLFSSLTLISKLFYSLNFQVGSIFFVLNGFIVIARGIGVYLFLSNN